MDILLIDPPYYALKGVPTDNGYNIGLTSLAAYLNKEGIETAVLMGDLLIDFPRENAVKTFIREFKTTTRYLAEQQQGVEGVINDKNHVIWKKMRDIIKETAPPVVGISYLTPFKRVVEKIASLTKEVNPDIRVIAGSFHPTFCPEEVMQNPDIDFVVRGEGEIPLLDLIKEIKKDMPDPKQVAGIHYRDRDGNILSTPDGAVVPDLDALPFPARDMVLNCDYNIYRSHSISSARGCPYTCAFCSDRRFWRGKIRRRSVDSIIQELRLLEEKYRADSVDFVDGTFTFDHKYVETFCRALIEQKLKITWRCTARYDNLDEELLQLMKKANCTAMYLGLESGSNRILKSIDKRETVENNLKVADLIHKTGIMTVTSVLFGIPDETPQDMEQTLAVMRKYKTDLFDVNSYVPLPGSPLYDLTDEEERAKINWGKVAYKSFDNNFTKRTSLEDLKKYLIEAYNISEKKRKRFLLRLGLRILAGVLSRALHLSKKDSTKSLFSYS